MKYNGCKEAFNLFGYEEYLKICPFKNIKNSLEIEYLVYFSGLPFNQVPYSNSALMNYSIRKAKEEININIGTPYIKDNDQIEEEYNNIIKGKGEAPNFELLRDIIETGKLFEKRYL